MPAQVSTVRKEVTSVPAGRRQVHRVWRKRRARQSTSLQPATTFRDPRDRAACADGARASGGRVSVMETRGLVGLTTAVSFTTARGKNRSAGDVGRSMVKGVNARAPATSNRHGMRRRSSVSEGRAVTPPRTTSGLHEVATAKTNLTSAQSSRPSRQASLPRGGNAEPTGSSEYFFANGFRIIPMRRTTW